MVIEERAKAKINLCLHIVGQRVDGYHLLDSLVAFADYGDDLTISADRALTLEVGGPFGRDLCPAPGNLILDVAQLFDPPQTARIHLTKNLPLASGIGGGSADAAATVRGLMRLYAVKSPNILALMKLGADIPVCQNSLPCRVQGIGDQLSDVPIFPDLPCVLVNPGIPLATPQVFAGLEEKHNPGSAGFPRNFSGKADFLSWLGDQRNDLQSEAIKHIPEITKVLDTLDRNGSQLSRMSGSGATCFGVFDSPQAAESCAKFLQSNCPGWWSIATKISGGGPAVVS